jgi:NAD(P)-dependent dehydrogenase (short-subunit alcohol dehydrogenase family)
MRQKRSGTLVTVGSLAAWYPLNGCNMYNASKAALRWAVMGMAEEIKGFNIRHCLIEPGFFRTNLLKQDANLAKTSSTAHFPDYDDLNKAADEAFAKFHGSQLGDPVKGVEVMYDVITSSGVAAGRQLPGFLPLGSDACTEIARTAQNIIDDINAWVDVAGLKDFRDRN